MRSLAEIAEERAAQQLAEGRWREPEEGEVFCEGPECVRRAVCQGLCNAHYMQRLRGKPLRPLVYHRPGNARTVARERLAARGIHVEET